MTTETDNPWDPGSALLKHYAKNLITGVSLEGMADATPVNLPDYALDESYKAPRLKIWVKQRMEGKNLLKRRFQICLSSMKR